MKILLTGSAGNLGSHIMKIDNSIILYAVCANPGIKQLEEIHYMHLLNLKFVILYLLCC